MFVDFAVWIACLCLVGGFSLVGWWMCLCVCCLVLLGLRFVVVLL